jgi:hypothetical protein
MWQFGPDFLSMLQTSFIATLVGLGVGAVLTWRIGIALREVLIDHKKAVDFIRAIAESIRDPQDKDRFIRRSEIIVGLSHVGERVEGVKEAIDSHCSPSNCSFHREIKDIMQKAVNDIEKTAAEGRESRLESSRRMDEIAHNYERVSDALLGFLGKFIDRARSQGDQGNS